jgi:hypothetical protein
MGGSDPRNSNKRHVHLIDRAAVLHCDGVQVGLAGLGTSHFLPTGSCIHRTGDEARISPGKRRLQRRSASENQP